MHTLTMLATTYFQERHKRIAPVFEHPHKTQQDVFHKLITKAQNTVRGKFYGYQSIKTYEDFASRVPPQTYESLQRLIQRAYDGEPHVLRPRTTNLFAKSSGTTTGKSKILPITSKALQACHYASGQDMLSLYIHLFPHTNMFKGKLFALGGSYEAHPDRYRAYEGDLSGLLAKNVPQRMQPMRFPPPRFARMHDRNEKIAQVADISLHQDIRCLAGIPSRLGMFLNHVKTTAQKDIIELRPNLEVLFHGGISIRPYEQELRSLLPNTHFMEVYNASEGFFALQDQKENTGLLLLLNRGIFYERKDMRSGVIVPLEGVELGKEYSMLISTYAGLRRYEIGDVITFTSLQPYRIRVVGRTKLYLNLYGEHVSIDNIEEVLKKITATHSFSAPEFVVGYDGKRHHRILETNAQGLSMETIADEIDHHLKELNDDYTIMRRDDCMLSKPKITIIPLGSTTKRLAKRNHLGGQHKVPRIDTNDRCLSELLKIANRE